MIPTRRALVLLRPALGLAAAAALAWALGVAALGLVLALAVVAWVVGLTILVVRDGLLAPDDEELVVVREVPRRVGLEGLVTERLTMDLAAESGDKDPAVLGRLSIEVHGTMPPALVPVELGVDADGEPVERRLDELELSRGQRVEAADARLVDLAGEPLVGAAPAGRDGRPAALWRFTVERTWRARRRGTLALGPVAVLATGPAGLARRRLVLGADETLRVQPALMGLSRTLQLVASERWQDLGLKRVRHRRGGQTEFESLRDYVVGDEPRSIDWKAFARRGRPTVRQYEPERGQEVIVVFDCGRRMAAPVVEPGQPEWTKLDHALDAGLQFAAAVLSQGDRVGLLAFDSRTHAWVAPARSGAQFARLEQAAFALEASTDETDLGAALAELSARHRRKALVLVISDLADPGSLAAQARALGRAGRHRIVFAAMNDPDVVRAADDLSRDRVPLRAAALAQLAERAEGLARVRARCAQALDVESSRAAGPLLAAWFSERRAGV